MKPLAYNNKTHSVDSIFVVVKFCQSVFADRSFVYMDRLWLCAHMCMGTRTHTGNHTRTRTVTQMSWSIFANRSGNRQMRMGKCLCAHCDSDVMVLFFCQFLRIDQVTGKCDWGIVYIYIGIQTHTCTHTRTRTVTQI